MQTIQHRARWAVGAVALAAVTTFATGCNIKDELLSPQNPGLIDTLTVVGTADAADALRIGALGSLRSATASGEGLWLYGGLLTDEWSSSDTFLQRNETDLRAIQSNNSQIAGGYNSIQQTRGYLRDAIEQMTAFLPEEKGEIGELYFALGFVEMQMAEDLCSGIPLGLSRKGVIDYSDPGYTPLTNAEVYARALAHLDTALKFTAGETDTHAKSVQQATLIARARLLVDQGQFAQAAALVPTSVVPTNYTYLLTFLRSSGDNGIWSLNTNQGRYTVSDSTAAVKNALPFISAKDPRVPVTDLKKKGLDGQLNLYAFAIGRSDPITLVSGIDARLIEAEGKLNAGDIPGTMAILNALRQSAQTIGIIKVPVMAALPVPATKDAATSLFFREKAFWTFGRGQRLGDERRLIRQYHRTQDQVFPVGDGPKGGLYGVDVVLPVTDNEKTNPNFHGCIDKSA
jgi:hypothetical protein